MIRFRANSGTDMKRFGLLLLSLLLLFTACSGERTFLRDEDGGGYTDKKSGTHYVALPFSYEPARGGKIYGVYEDEERDVIRNFREIPELDVALFLADDDRVVYFAGEDFITADRWEAEILYVCVENAVSVEEKRLTVADDATALCAVLDLWFDGESAVLPDEAAAYSRRLKFSGTTYPNLFYCFTFYSFGAGRYYFHDTEGDRTVAVPDGLAAHFLPAGGS